MEILRLEKLSLKFSEPGRKFKPSNFIEGHISTAIYCFRERVLMAVLSYPEFKSIPLTRAN